MSSILDALNKLEQEQERARQSAQPAEIDAKQAAQELVSRDVLRDHVTLKVSPLTMAIGGAVAVLFMVVAAVGVTVMVMGGDDDAAPAQENVAQSQSPAVNVATAVPTATPAAISTPTPAPEETVDAVVAESASPVSDEPPAMEKKVEAEAAPSLPEAPAVEKPTPAAQPTIEKKSEPAVVQPEPGKEPVVFEERVVVAETPKPVPEKQVVQAETSPRPSVPEQTTTSTAVAEETLRVASATPTTRTTAPPPSARTEISASSRQPEPDTFEPNIAALPVFTRSVQAEYGLKKLRINMLRPKSDSVPYPSAVINMVTVFEGETILNSRVRLFKVESHGIGVEATRSGEQYYMKF